MGKKYIIEKDLSGNVLSKKLFDRVEWTASKPDVLKGVFFEFDDDEREEIIDNINALCPSNKIDVESFIREIETACNLANAREPKRKRKNEQLDQLIKKIHSFNATIDDIKNFSEDNFQHDSFPDEVYLTASKMSEHLVRLESLLESKKKMLSKKFSTPGRSKNDTTIAVGRGVKDVFEHFKLHISKSDTGLFVTIFLLCLNALEFHYKDIGRILLHVFDETSEK